MDVTLTTSIKIFIENFEHIEGVSFSEPGSTLSNILVQNCTMRYKDADIGLFIFFGMPNNDMEYGKSSSIGRCDNLECSGWCSENPTDRMVAVHYNDNDTSTGLVISHEVGHIMGLHHDFHYSRGFKMKMPKVSYEGNVMCTDICGFMDYFLSECGKRIWSTCSSQDLRMYYHRAKNVASTFGSTCFKPF